jgi:hypothetical protein
MTRRRKDPAPDCGQANAHRRRFLQTSALLASGLAVESIVPGQLAAAPPPLPTAVDLRAKNGNKYITSVKDQGACHSCTAFGVIATIEGSYHLQKHKPIGAANPELNLSEADLFAKAPPLPRDCNIDHWWPRTALDYCIATGVPQKPATPTLFKIATKQQLVASNPEDTITAMKAWIADDNGGPVTAVMVEFDDFLAFGVNRGTGTNDVTDVYDPGWDPHAPRPRLLGGHVISIVGYEDSHNGRYWICKNSWFVNNTQPWNRNGYVRIKMKGLAYLDRIDVWGVKI